MEGLGLCTFFNHKNTLVLLQEPHIGYPPLPWSHVQPKLGNSKLLNASRPMCDFAPVKNKQLHLGKSSPRKNVGQLVGWTAILKD